MKNITPKEIVFIDDKMYILQAVGNAAKSLGIPFVGIRYKYLDKKVKAFKVKEYESNKPGILKEINL